MVIKGHKRGVWDISFSPVEKVLASASGDYTIKLWNLSDGSCVINNEINKINIIMKIIIQINTLEGHLGTVIKI